MAATPNEPYSVAHRRRALNVAAAVLSAPAAVDAVAGREAVRIAIWVAWIAGFLAIAQVLPRVSPRSARALGFAAAALAGLAGVLLVATSGGSESPFFPALPVIPILAAVMAPDDLEDAAVVALAMAGAGVAVLLWEGKGATWILLWAAPLLTFLALGLRSAVQHRRRHAAAIADASGRADELEVLADSERSLARLQRLARIALFAETVAHDLNSPLSAVLANVSFARRELEIEGGSRAETAEALADAAAAAARMKEIVSELRQLAQHELAQEGEEPARYAPAEALREAVRAAALRVPGLAAVREELPAELPQPAAPRYVLVELALQLVVAQVEAGAEEVVLGARSEGNRLLISALRRGGGPLEGELPPPFAICRAYARRLHGTFDASHGDRTWELTVGLPTADREKPRVPHPVRPA